MAVYMAQVSATSNATAGTEDAFIDISVPAASAAFIREIVVSTQSAASDSRARVLLFRKSAVGAGGVAGTIVRRDPADRASGATITIKSGATAFGAGTKTDTLDEWELNGRTTWRWIPGFLESSIAWGLAGAAQIFGINIINNTASIVMNIIVVWDE